MQPINESKRNAQDQLPIPKLIHVSRKANEQLKQYFSLRDVCSIRNFISKA